MAIVIRDNERLYLSSWEYNAARILTELAHIVENNNGRVKPMHSAIISDRSLHHAQVEYQERIDRLNDCIKRGKATEATYKALEAAQEKINKYSQVNNDPITVTHTTYISFVLDNIYYYFEVDDNPFFDFYYRKSPVVNGKVSRDAAGDNATKDWLFDCFLYSGCVQEDIKEAANLIFNWLVQAKNSEVIRDSKRIRVSNYYNNGYHYETVYQPERFEEIKF